MGLFSKKPSETDVKVAALVTALGEVTTRLEQAETDKARLQSRVDEMQVQVNGIAAAAAAASVSAESASLRANEAAAAASRPRAVDELEDVVTQLGQLAERISSNDIATRQATEQVATLTQRVNQISTELANQLAELSNDIDSLTETRPVAAAVSLTDEVLDMLRTAQVNLAAEQARYEIAFRQDLAALAEQVRQARRP